jgi:hypothetical protein
LLVSCFPFSVELPLTSPLDFTAIELAKQADEAAAAEQGSAQAAGGQQKA